MGSFNRSNDSKGRGFGGRPDSGGRGFGGGRDGGRRSFGGGRDGGRSSGGSRGGFGGGSFGGGRDRDSGPREMFSAVCDACGKNCEVPFRPTQGKPIFCSECFEKKENGQDFGNVRSGNQYERSNDRFERSSDRFGGNDFRVNDKFVSIPAKSNDDFKVQYEILNAKLDKILKLLEPKPIRVENVAPEFIKKTKEVKKVTPVVAEEKAVEVVKKAVTKKVVVKKAASKKK